jgi:hypothetical protein
MRVKVSVSIEKIEYERAQKNGLNTSQICSNALKVCNDAIEGAMGKTHVLGEASLSKEGSVVGLPGFEPESIEPKSTDFWVKFRAWLKSRNYNKAWESTLFNYALEFKDCLEARDLARIRDLGDSKRPNVLAALSSYAKFTGQYDVWRGLVKSYGFGWGGRSADDVVIDRLNNVSDPNEIWEWVKSVKEMRPDLVDFMDLMSFTGLRFVETLNCYQLIQRLALENKLGTYYNAESSALEHFHFKEVFMRKSKKAFVSFTPAFLIKNIEVSPSLVNPGSAVKRSGLLQRFGDIREAHGTLMVKYLKESEINFLHGRVTSSVFMANYFNPSLIGDLKARVFEGIAEIQKKLC